VRYVIYIYDVSRLRVNDLAKILTKYERMPGKTFSSFLQATTQIVCPLRWRFRYYITLKVSIYFIVTLYSFTLHILIIQNKMGMPRFKKITEY
jgi:hypothetical protein